MSDVPRTLALTVAVLALTFGNGWAAGVQDSTSATTSTTTSTAVGDAPAPTTNPFLPEHQDVGNCISAVQRPDCGSSAQGGGHQYLVLLALLLGLGLIGWRVVAGVRRAERARHG